MKARLAHSISRLANRLSVDQRGATATEYSILVGFIAIVTVAGVQVFGIALNGHYLQLAAGLKTALGLP